MIFVGNFSITLRSRVSCLRKKGRFDEELCSTKVADGDGYGNVRNGGKSQVRASSLPRSDCKLLSEQKDASCSVSK